MHDYQKELREFIKKTYQNIEERSVTRGYSYLWSGAKRFHIYRVQNDGSFRYLIYTSCRMNMPVAIDVQERMDITIYEGYVRNGSDLIIAMERIREERDYFLEKSHQFYPKSVQSPPLSSPSLPTTQFPQNGNYQNGVLDEQIGKYEDYLNLLRRINKCDDCKRMRHGSRRTGDRRILLGWGNIDAEIMFIGEAPHEEYARSGMILSPYSDTGRKILRILLGGWTEIQGRQALLHGVDAQIKGTFKRGYTIWLTNCVKCCFPYSETEEKKGFSSRCRTILIEEINLIDPEILILFGDKAKSALKINKRKKYRGDGISFNDDVGNKSRTIITSPHPLNRQGEIVPVLEIQTALNNYVQNRPI